MDSMMGFLKLTAPPIQVKLFTKYRIKALPEGLSEEEKKKYKPEMELEQESAVQMWMHPMTGDEMVHVEAVGVEAFNAFKDKSGNEEDAFFPSRRVEMCQLIFFVLRKGKEKDSPRVFEKEQELMLVHFQEIKRLDRLYWDTFRPSDDEIKNSLRERIGDGCKTESPSPSTSKTPG